MTTAEKVRKAVAEYLRIDLVQVTDDLQINDHMGPTFIAIKLGLTYSGMIGGTVTVGQLIAKFTETAQTEEPKWDYEETPKITCVRDAVVVAVAKHRGMNPADVTDETVVELKGYEERDAFSNHMFRMLGFSTGADWRDEKNTVEQLTADYEDLQTAARHGV